MRRSTVLKLLFAPLRIALDAAEQVLDLLAGPAPAPHPQVLDAVGPWAHVDEIPL